MEAITPLDEAGQKLAEAINLIQHAVATQIQLRGVSRQPFTPMIQEFIDKYAEHLGVEDLEFLQRPWQSAEDTQGYLELKKTQWYKFKSENPKMCKVNRLGKEMFNSMGIVAMRCLPVS